MIQPKYLIKRIVITIVLIFSVITALFFFFRLMPGDFTGMLVQEGASPEELMEVREKWGLNEPLYVQYFNYMMNLATGDLGNSFRYGQTVVGLTLPRLLNSFVLIAPAIITAYILGSIFGAIMGSNRGSWIEKYGIIPVTVFGTVPEFFLGILMITVFASWLNWFPISGMVSLSSLQQTDVTGASLYLTRDFWWHFTLPFLTIVLRYLYLPSLIMRTSVVEVVGQDFTYYHRIKGLARRSQLRHIMKHASLPVITLFPVSMTRAVGGMVLIEVVFNWPGIGALLVESVLTRDYPVVQFVFYLVAIWVIIGNFIVDIVYSSIDPRIAIEDGDS